MEKKTYFKIVEMPEHQVLVEKCWQDTEDEEGVPTLAFTYYPEPGLKLATSLGFESDEKLELAFAKVGPEMVAEVIATTSGMFNSKDDEDESN